MDAAYIDLNDYVLSGEGANGQSYNCLGDSSLMVKLYNPGYDRKAIIEELERARKVFALGVPSPEPGELVTDGSRLGISFERIPDKRSFSRAIADEPERAEELSREFACECKKIHAIECPEGMFSDARSSFLKMLDANGFIGDEAVGAIRNFIANKIPDCRTVLHGDMHVGNVLTTLAKGHPVSEKHKIYFIDLGYFERGYPLLDIGMMDSICNWSDDSFLEHDFHFSRPVAHRVWDAFIKEYFFGPERLADKFFEPGASENDVRTGLIPYTIVKLMLVGYNLGFMPEGYMKFIEGNLKTLA